jgi:hypothetical protein
MTIDSSHRCSTTFQTSFNARSRGMLVTSIDSNGSALTSIQLIIINQTINQTIETYLSPLLEKPWQCHAIWPI